MNDIVVGYIVIISYIFMSKQTVFYQQIQNPNSLQKYNLIDQT